MDKKLSGLPPFSLKLLTEHLITDSSGKHGKPANAHKHKKYGYQQFKDKMVTQVLVKPNVLKGDETFFLVKSNVHASMKKTNYTVYVHLNQTSTGKVSHANCSCKAGQGGCCKHVAALLFQILDFIELELTVVQEDLTCTQLLQQWHVPSNDKLETALLFDPDILIILKFLMRPIALSTCAVRAAIFRVSVSSLSDSLGAPFKNGGIFSPTPAGISFSMSNPLSAIT